MQLRTLLLTALGGLAFAAPQATTSLAVDAPLSTVTPSSLNYTYYFANAACSGPNMTGMITPNKCTFIEFDDGQGALSFAPFQRGNDFLCTSTCYLETWNAETCSGSPASIIRATDASNMECASTLGGKSVMLVC